MGCCRKIPITLTIGASECNRCLQQQSSSDLKPTSNVLQYRRTSQLVSGLKAVREHGSVMSVPVALQPLLRIVLLFQLEKFRKLGIAAFNLLSSGIAMVRQIVSASAPCGHVDETSEGVC